MRPTHTERLLMAQTDESSAFKYKNVAEARVVVCQDAVDGFLNSGEEAPHGVVQELQRARREFLELERITRRYIARTVDAWRHSNGDESDFESAEILHDVTHPIR